MFRGFSKRFLKFPIIINNFKLNYFAVVIDRKRDPNCDTGFFVCIYKQTLLRPPAYLGMSLSVRGRRIFKRSKSRKDKENERKNGFLSTKKTSRLTAPFTPGMRINGHCTQIDHSAGYNGPVIADLMEEIQNSSNSIDSDPNDGIEVAQPIKPTTTKKRSKPSTSNAHHVSNASNYGLLCPRVMHRSQAQRSTPSSRSCRRGVNSRTPRTAPRHSSRTTPLRMQPPSTSGVQKQEVPTRGGGIDLEYMHLDMRNKDTFNKHNHETATILSTKQQPHVQLVAYSQRAANRQLESLELLHKLKDLQVLRKSMKKDEYDDKLLTVGKSLGRLMRPHT